MRFYRQKSNLIITERMKADVSSESALECQVGRG